MIELQSITKVYNAGDVPLVALDRVSVHIARGEMLAIVGASGSGKSTLMNILGCLDRPTRGAYLLEGRDTGKMTDSQLARLRGRRIGFVFQSFNLLARKNALQQVELPLIYLGERDRQRRAIRALGAVGLAERWRHRPTQLSGGQQQRVAIARALVTNPAIILADEPTGALDSQATADLMEMLVDLNRTRGITVILVTHEAEVAAYTHRVITIRDGRIVSDAAPERTNVVAFPGADARPTADGRAASEAERAGADA
jgi:ABC-type lipoprotein export system ATPase subunit